MASDARKRTGRRSVDRHGQDVTHRTYTQTGTDDYGDPIYSESTSTVTARISRGQGSADLVRNVGGEEISADAVLYVKDSVSVTDIDEGDGRPDEFGAGDTTYKVLRASDQDSGIVRVECVRK